MTNIIKGHYDCDSIVVWFHLSKSPVCIT